MIRTVKILLIAWSLALSAGSVRADGEKPNCFLVSAGVDIYASQKVPDLKGCVVDAETATRIFRQQEGTLFGKVVAHTLTNATATRGQIVQELARLKKAGKAGDYAVIFLSGHGGRDNPGWHFLPSDYDPANSRRTGLDDATLMSTADTLATRGLKVVVIIDACFSGNLRLSGKAALDRHQKENGGGIVLFLSSSPGQVSQALGQYSAFAQAMAEALSGKADINHDGKVTLSEARRYAYNRVYQMLKERNIKGEQDGDVDYSPSLSDSLVLAMYRPGSITLKTPNPPATPAAKERTWVGSEDLAGFGKLAFRFSNDGKAVMIDARKEVMGTWTTDSKGGVTIRFQNCIYEGRFNGNELSGQAHFTAGNNTKPWAYRVTRKED